MSRSIRERLLVEEVILADRKRSHLSSINSVPPASFYGNHKTIMKQQQSMMTLREEDKQPEVILEDLNVPGGVRKLTRTSGKTTTTTTTTTTTNKPTEQDPIIEDRENDEIGYGEDMTTTRFHEDHRLKRKFNKNKTYRKNARFPSREIEEEENEDLYGNHHNNTATHNNNHHNNGGRGGDTEDPHGVIPSRHEGGTIITTITAGHHGAGKRGRGRKAREYRKSRNRETNSADEVEYNYDDGGDEEENDGQRHNEDDDDHDRKERGRGGRRREEGKDDDDDNEDEDDGDEEEEEDEEEEGDEEDDENFIGEGDEDTERRRKEAVQFMNRIEKEFDQLKGRLYVEKLASLNRDIEQLMDGTLPDFNEQLHALERRRKERLKSAESFYDYQLLCLKLRQECEAQQAEQDYVNDRDSLHERMLAALQERKRKLEEEKMSMDISSMELTAEDRTQTRKLRRRGMEPPLLDTKAVKKKIISGPQFVQQLLDSEILEDLYIIRKSLNPSATRRSTTSTKKP